MSSKTILEFSLGLLLICAFNCLSLFCGNFKGEVRNVWTFRRRNSNIRWLHFKLQRLFTPLPLLTSPVNYGGLRTVPVNAQLGRIMCNFTGLPPAGTQWYSSQAQTLLFG